MGGGVGGDSCSCKVKYIRTYSSDRAENVNKRQRQRDRDRLADRQIDKRADKDSDAEIAGATDTD